MRRIFFKTDLIVADGLVVEAARAEGISPGAQVKQLVCLFISLREIIGRSAKFSEFPVAVGTIIQQVLIVVKSFQQLVV